MVSRDKMEQWTGERWKQLDALLDATKTHDNYNELIETTRSQEEHPEWWENPCLCELCCSYGD